MMKEQELSSELRDWSAALQVMREEKGDRYAQTVLSQLAVSLGLNPVGEYWNSQSPLFPVDVALVERSSRLVRWNAMVMVVKAGTYGSEIGGHISSYASSTHLYEVGFNYFFRGSETELGDLILFQGHSSPGIYARSFLLGQLSQEQVSHFRREVDGKGISSYPHPWLMPSYWQFPTVSMGLGPLQGIYHAKLMKYLEARGLLPESDRQVWVFCGDGEMDEVESLGALGVASREGLDNLIFVINCNLVRLDGPCRGSGQIMPELNGYFSGAGWEVIQLVWSQAWLALVEKDRSGYLKQKLMGLRDGAIQAMFVNEDALKAWFEADAKLADLVAGWDGSQFAALLPGGHDIQLVANAFSQAQIATKPVVILAMTKKGFGIPNVCSTNSSHNQKSLSEAQILDYAKFLQRDNHALEWDLAKDDPAMSYMQQQRKKLGGHLPMRRMQSESLKVPGLEAFQSVCYPEVERKISTTMAFVRLLNLMLRDKVIKERIVPILADEGRTLGMEGLFRQIGIYQRGGQQYTPHDREDVSYYREDGKGQLLQEGINEAGATSMWLAAGTSYSVHNLPLIPFYSYYSMFGFQRVGDLIWAAADSRVRGFLMGATAGRTTLGGEGLQHNDATSLLMASTIPNCKSYDPCYAYEMAVIIQKGLEEMYQQQLDVFYYMTMINETYIHPSLPEGVEEGICKGMYCIEDSPNSVVDLMGSGTILRQMQLAAKWLRDHTSISIRVWSVTSWSELARDAQAKKLEQKPSYLEQCLGDSTQLVVAASDYVRAVPGLLHDYIGRPYHTLGTDGFGMSDTRESLRSYYGVSEKGIVKAVLEAMVEMALIDKMTADAWIEDMPNINPMSDDRRSV